MTINDLLQEVTKAISRGNGENQVRASMRFGDYGPVEKVHHADGALLLLCTKEGTSDLSQH